MKKILLGTAALVGTAVMAQGAAAQVTVKFGGDIRFDAGWVDDDLANAKDFDFQTEVRLPITAEGKTDNGLTYGAFVRLRNTGQRDLTGAGDASVTEGEDLYAERKYIYVGGAFGRLEMGDEWGPMTKRTGFAPTVGIAQVDGGHSNYTAIGSWSYVPATYYNRDTKISYYTPNFSGFSAGVSYTPKFGQKGDNNSLGRRLNANRTYEDIVEVAAGYNGSFSGATVNVGAGYAWGEAVNSANKDFETWNISAAVGFGGFTVGGNIFDIDHANTDGWTVGASYKNGPVGVAASYGRSETGSFDDDIWAIGAVYTVAPGLNVMGDLYFVDSESANNDATVLMLRTQLLF